MGECQSSILITAPHGNQSGCDEMEDPLSHDIAKKMTAILRTRGYCVCLHSGKGKLGRRTVDYNRPEVMYTNYGRKFINHLQGAKCHVDIHSFSDTIPWGDGKSIVVLSHNTDSNFERIFMDYIRRKTKFNVIRYLASNINALTYTSYSQNIPSILLEFPYTKNTKKLKNKHDCCFQVEPGLIETAADALQFTVKSL